MNHRTAETIADGGCGASAPAQVFSFNPDDPNGSFPEALRHDDWVAFHGTTGDLAERIEAEGFHWSEGQIAKCVIDQVVAIGKRLVWIGPDPGGLSTLIPFTLEFDFAQGARKPIFFGESTHRSLLYALREMAGGETMYALRNTFRYFEMLLTDPAMRARRMTYLERQSQAEFGDFTPEQLLVLRDQAPEYYARYAVEEIDMEWLGEQWASLAEVRQRSQAVLDAHTHGVVFAVRFTEEDLAHLSWHKSMGILADGPVPPSRIVGKVVIPLGASFDNFGGDDTAKKRLLSPSGLYKRLLEGRSDR